MKTLKFIIERGYNIKNIIPAPINEESVEQEKNKWNKKCQPIIDELNSLKGGCVTIRISYKTGLVESSTAAYTPELLDKIHELP